MKTINIVSMLTVIMLLGSVSSCSLGDDYTPDVTAHAASFGGYAPTFTQSGRMSSISEVGNSGRRGSNIFDR